MPFLLGQPGYLQTLPLHQRDYTATLIRSGGIQTLADGTSAADDMGSKWRYELSWKWLGTTSGYGLYGTLERLRSGYYGRGPWALIDPHPQRRNLLTLNQSTGTTYRRDTSGFTPSWSGTPGALASVAFSVANVTPNGGACALSIPMTSGTGIATVYTTTTTAVADSMITPPAITGLQYTGSWYVKIASGGPASAAARLQWQDTTGSSTVTTGSVVALSTSWQRITVTGTAPANSAYVALSLVPSSVTQPCTLYAADPQLEQGGTVTAWEIGFGVPRMVIDQMPASVPLHGSIHASAVLLEAA